MMRAALTLSIAVLLGTTFDAVPTRAGEAQPFPSPESVLRKVSARAAAQRSGEKPAPYLCTRQTVTEELDKNGRVTERKVKIGQTHSRPGGAAEAEKWTSQNGISLDEELLRRYEFTVVDRESFEGRPTLVLTFVPKDPPAPVRRFQDRLLNRTFGTIWVDEQENELVKASISLGEPVSFGILGAVESFSFSFERGRALDGNWLTRWTDTTVNARKFLKPIQTRKRVDWTDFKKLASQ